MDPLPNFANEQEEADWWDAHPDALTHRFAAGKRAGLVRGLSQTTLPGADSSIVRLPPEELTRVRNFAEKRGLGYQDYLNKLLREALDNEERELAS